MASQKFAYDSFSGTDMIAQAFLNYNVAGKPQKVIYTLGSLQTLTYSIHMDRKPVRAIGNINARDYVMGPRTVAGTLMFAVFNKHFAYEMMSAIRGGSAPESKFLADELPPFDIVISFANEYGAKSKMVLYGLKLINEGQVMSINDIYTENTYQFVALDIDYMDPETDTVINNTKPPIVIKAKKNTTTIIPSSTETITKKKTNRVSLIAEQMTLPKITGGSSSIRLTLSPPQNDGHIIINTNPATEKTIDINVNNFAHQTISTTLVPGKYNASFAGIDTISNLISFTVSDYVSVTNYNTQAPGILSITDTTINIFSNTLGHSKVKYLASADYNANAKYLEEPFKGLTAKLIGLKPNTTYYICTANTSETSISKLIQVKTSTNGSEPYTMLKNYMRYNSNKLSQMYITYSLLIEEVSLWGSKQGLAITESFTKYKVVIQEEIKSTNPLLFPSIEAYNSKMQQLESKLSACKEIIPIVINLMNDKTYALNKANGLNMTKPPKAEIENMLNSVLIVDKNTRAIEIYRSLGKEDVLEKVALAQDFYNYSEGYNAYKFIGKPEYKYRAYSIDKNGTKSSAYEFYINSDEDKKNIINAYVSNQDLYNLKYNSSKSLKSNNLSANKISDKNIERVLIQTLKTISKPSVRTPWIISASSNEIVVGIDNKDIVGDLMSFYYVAIAPISEAGKSKPFYKAETTLFNNTLDPKTVSFTAEDHGIKDDTIYAIWIEDVNHKQISQCTTTSLNIEDNELEDEIRNYILNEKVDKIKKELILKLGSLSEVNMCIENLKSDISLNEFNIYDTLVSNVISIKPQLSNLENIIKAIYEVIIDTERFSNLYFFDSKLIYEKNNNIVTLPANSEGYTLVVEHIDQNNNNLHNRDIMYIQGNTQKVLNINSIEEFVIISATARDISNKSGMLFINTSTRNAKGYKLNVEVIR
jgi:hypothetical protein